MGVLRRHLEHSQAGQYVAPLFLRRAVPIDPAAAPLTGPQRELQTVAEIAGMAET